MISKGILTSILMVGIIAVGAGAGTLAYFSDTETSTGNTFTAGTLNLVLTDSADDGTESETATWVAPNMAPGDTGGAVLQVDNTGTIAGTLDLANVAVANAPGPTPESESLPDNGELGANLLVHMFFDVNGNGAFDVGDTDIYGTDAGLLALDGIAAVLYDLDYALGAGATTNISMNWDLPTTTGNDCQGDIATLTFTVELDQIAD